MTASVCRGLPGNGRLRPEDAAGEFSAILGASRQDG